MHESLNVRFPELVHVKVNHWENVGHGWQFGACWFASVTVEAHEHTVNNHKKNVININVKILT